jgi:transcriptional regulator with XRE-family HTH domain
MEARAATQPDERQRLPAHHARDRLPDPGAGGGAHTTNVTDGFPNVKWKARIPPVDRLGGGAISSRAYPTRFHEWFDRELTDRGWGDREAGRRIGVNHVTVGGIRNGSTRTPSLEVLTKIADALEADLATLRRWLHEPAGPETPPSTDSAMTVAGDIRDFIRLTARRTAEEFVEQMTRRRPHADPASDPVIVEMVAEINAELARMSLAEIEEARRCFRQDLQRHRREERERVQS